MDNEEFMNKEESQRNGKRGYSITPDPRAPKEIVKIQKIGEEGYEAFETPKGHGKDKGLGRKNLFGVGTEGGMVQAKVEKCRKCDGMVVCVGDTGEGENMKCQGCWVREMEEWEEKRREKEECKQCEEKQKMIEKLEEDMDMESMARRLQTQPL